MIDTLFRIVLTGILLFVVAWCLNQAWSLWRSNRIILSPFTFHVDGEENAAQGLAFTQRVLHELHALRVLLETQDEATDDAIPQPAAAKTEDAKTTGTANSSAAHNNATAPPAATIKTVPAAQQAKAGKVKSTGKANSAKDEQNETAAAAATAQALAAAEFKTMEAPPPPMPPSLAGHLTFPELRRDSLAEIEMTVQGIDIASLARNVAKWVRPLNEFQGIVIQDGDKFTVQVEHSSISKGTSQFRIADVATAKSAASSTAANIAYQLIKDGDAGKQFTISSEEFGVFCRVLRLYSEYRTAHLQVESAESIAEKKALLDESDRLCEVLIKRGVGNKFPPVLVAGTIIANELKDPQRAEMHRAAYGEVPIAAADQKAAAAKAKTVKFLARLFPNPSPPAFAMSPPSETDQIQPGSAIVGSRGRGTICCIVQDDKGLQYLLTADQILANTIGSAVLLPNGKQIAKTASWIKTETAVATLAIGVTPDTFNPRCRDIGEFKGTAVVTAADRGKTVRFFGAVSGAGRGTIVKPSMDTTVESPAGPQALRSVVACQGVAGRPFCLAGDSGAPVVNEDDELIGMIYAADAQSGIGLLIPIESILQGLNVTLVK